MDIFWNCTIREHLLCKIIMLQFVQIFLCLGGQRLSVGEKVCTGL